MIYRLTVRLPEEDQGADARLKLDLLTTIFLSAVEGVKRYRVVKADFDGGCIEALVESVRFPNVTSGRVIVSLERTDRVDVLPE